MNQLTPRKLNALVLIGLGILLLQAPSALLPHVPETMLLLQAGINLLAAPGLLLFFVGLYRFWSKAK